jgi:RNase P/RNase MRP subunit POP5
MVRYKHRFLIVQIRVAPDSTYSPDDSEILAGIQVPFTNMFGIFGAGSALVTLRMVNWDRGKRLGIFRVARDWATNLRDFLQALDSLNSIPLEFVVHHTAGTIDQAQKWMDANDFVFF